MEPPPADVRSDTASPPYNNPDFDSATLDNRQEDRASHTAYFPAALSHLQSLGLPRISIENDDYTVVPLHMGTSPLPSTVDHSANLFHIQRDIAVELPQLSSFEPTVSSPASMLLLDLADSPVRMTL